MAAAVFSAPQSASAGACKPITFEGTSYILCTPEEGKGTLRLFWQNADGKPYRYFSRLAKSVIEEGQRLVFAINAGMYREDFSPLGLYIEDGQELRPADTGKSDGAKGPVPNFYKKPNGVFFVGEKQAGILTTETFLKERPKVQFATQSGPMLVIANKFHPAFIVGSKDRTRRSGIGICEKGAVHIAISEDPVNFHDFARLFRDHLKCPNALFLDGGQGAGIYEPALGRNDFSWHGGFGPILGLVE
ncbi:phosphodiester glycosidase family protein [Brucella sp. BE17]|uniref:phosphodiester glycosidase family protein n=1 Tax=Brucella sp. BE17 TaxID=3142977 RepID=UPI0031BA1481